MENAGTETGWQQWGGLFALFEQVEDGVCVADASGKVIYANRAAVRLLADTSARGLANICETLCGRLEGENGLSIPIRDCPLRRAAAERQERAVTFSGRHGPRSEFNWRDDHVERAQRWRDLRVRCLRAGLPGKRGGLEEVHLVFIEDAASALELERRRAGWRGMVAHDLRAPLSSVYSSLLLLQEERATGSSDERKIIAAGLSSCRRMMELLDLYLEVSRLDAKEVAVSVEDVELEPLVRSVAEAQAPLASSRKISVSLAVPSGLSARADAALLRRVVENLLNNAIKFSPVSGSARIEAAASGAAVSLSFRDSGRGVPKEDLPSLFERYRGAEAQLGETRCGASLGLAFCRQALELMGGSIAARSRPGRGGEFVVSLPRSE